MRNYADLSRLLDDDASAQQYFDVLPHYVQGIMRHNGRNINSFDHLHDTAQPYLRRESV